MVVPLMFVRFRAGVVGESRRVTHLVPYQQIDGDPVHPGVLTALCGQTLSPRDCDVLVIIGGAPCVDCLRRSPGPAGAAIQR
jgi:hypothetical protein